MPTIDLISVTGHVALAGIYNPPSLLLILYFLHLQQVPQQVPILREVTCTFIPEESVPFAVPPGLGCCSFALICSQDVVAQEVISCTPDIFFLTSIVEKQSNFSTIIWISRLSQHCYAFLSLLV